MALIKCSECGKEFSDKAKACPNCACPVDLDDKVENNNEIVCPNCHSNDIKVQIVSQREKRGCISVLFYVLLALTIIGIPIVIVILLARGNKTSNYKYWVCQKCGNTFVPGVSKKQTIWATILCIFIACFVFAAFKSGEGIESSDIKYPYIVLEDEMVYKEQFDIKEEIYCPNETFKIDKVSYKSKVGNYVPDKGHVFVEIQVSLSNKTSNESTFYLSDFKLVTSNGEIINPLVPVNSNDLNGNKVISGGKYTGVVRFSIPKTQKEYEIRYDCGKDLIKVNITK